MNNASAPEIKKERVISPIWLLPILAIVLGAWLLFKAWSEAGVKIDIVFESAKGITAGQTQLFYQGLDIGVVKSVALAPKLEGVIVKAEVKREAEQLLKADSQFWLVTPKASITEISGLDALVSGNYIELNPGTGKYDDSFVALSEPPNIIRGKGLNVRLNADDLGSLNIGSAIYFKKIKVGEVQRYQLTDEHKVEFDIQIRPQFAHLVKIDTRFWNVSGFEADISLDGMQISSESLASVISGGVSFDSPLQSAIATKGQSFTLYDNLKDSHRGKPIQISMQQQNGLVAGRSKLVYRGANIGFVSEIINNGSHDQFTAKALVEPKYEDLFNSSTQLVLIKPEIGLNGVKNIGALVGAKQIEVIADQGELATQFELSLAPKPPQGSKTFTLTTDNVKGVSSGSPIVYNGLTIGKVLALTLKKRSFELSTYIAPEFASLLTINSRFYNQSPLAIEADLNGITVESSGLSGFIQSPIILLPGQSKKTSTSKTFRLHHNKQAALLSKEKALAPLKLTVNTDYLGSLAEGAPVLYRRVPVGKVDSYQLLKDGKIEVELEIYGNYRYLVTDNTRFWHASGLEIKASLEGLSVNSESLKSLVLGGISFDQFDELAKETQRTIYKSKQLATKRHLNIALSTQDSHGIYNNMPIKYQGQQIGKITQLRFSEDLSTLTASAELDFPYYRNFARSGSLYWQESASISLSEVKNLDTLVKGDFINALPGKGKPLQTFKLLKEVPNTDKGSLHVWLSSSHFGSLKIGSPVLYKQYKVGTVDKAKLELDGSKILARLNIDSNYRHLVRANSVFWNASGVDVKLGLGGADIRLDSMETLLTGGIAFATPETTPLAELANDNDKYQLQSTYDEKWLQWSPSIQP
ncbi:MULTISPECIES: PqiB family protein [unclassified Agarivorans]|uniref:PqiB family protein n=1 Tax=unclassified Agarivorans TaxID=2636026 RepID=UPI0026E20A9C|nr:MULTISPECIES: MlaD family protein [unclassified Agarivorans]MDO6685997.1 MlaD family protein [Agarivorans sp. 3_MG-2023]MDO6713865.1 MlaD family protein [Agarivorans sp. 2_MG-2023]